MKLTRDCQALGMMLGVFLGSALWAGALAAQHNQQTLSGVESAFVLVDFSATDKPPSGIDEDRLRTVLELHLRQAGMRIVSQDAAAKADSIVPYALLRVTILETENEGGGRTGYAYGVQLSMRMFTLVPFNKSIAPTELWVNGTLGVSNRKDARAHLESLVRTLADGLVNEWLAQNPR